MVTFEDIINNLRFECPKCKSRKLMLFTARNVTECAAFACMDCMNFEVRAKDKVRLLSELNALS